MPGEVPVGQPGIDSIRALRQHIEGARLRYAVVAGHLPIPDLWA